MHHKSRSLGRLFFFPIQESSLPAETMGGKASWRVKPGKSGWRFLLLPIGNGKTALTAVFPGKRLPHCRRAALWDMGCRETPKIAKCFTGVKENWTPEQGNRYPRNFPKRCFMTATAFRPVQGAFAAFFSI